MPDRRQWHALSALPHLAACALLLTGCKPPEATTRPVDTTEKTATTSPSTPGTAGEQSEESRKREAEREARAKIDVRQIAEQAKIYRLNNDVFPTDVAMLTRKQPEGGAPLMPPERAQDPWGKPYQIAEVDGDVVVSTRTPAGKVIDSGPERKPGSTPQSTRPLNTRSTGP
jgi:hypothetical protein